MTVAATSSIDAADQVRSQRDSFNYHNAYVFNPDTRRFDRYNTNRAYEGHYNAQTGRWEPDYYNRYYNNNPQRRYDNDGRWYNSATGRYEYENAKWWNPATGRYEYTVTTNRYDPRYENNYYDDRRRYFNSQTGRYEYHGNYPIRRYIFYQNLHYNYEHDNNNNWISNSHDNYYNNNRRWYNSATGRYEYGGYYDQRYNSRYNDRYAYDRYANDPEFERRKPDEYYGRGSVDPVHVPKVRYDNEHHWQTLRDVRVSDDDGYHFSYETENAIRSAEDARVIFKGTPNESLAKTGFYEYVGDDGKTYRVDWVADENGFHASVRQWTIVI